MIHDMVLILWTLLQGILLNGGLGIGAVLIVTGGTILHQKSRANRD